jgi:hypothetical protein
MLELGKCDGPIEVEVNVVPQKEHAVTRLGAFSATIKTPHLVAR